MNGVLEGVNQINAGSTTVNTTTLPINVGRLPQGLFTNAIFDEIQIYPGAPQTSPLLEYQYHLKDHLGNVRTTFTTKRTVESAIATFEPASLVSEQNQFQRYNSARLVNSTLFDHTRNGTTAYSERLSGSANEKTGIARSVSVMAGDTINLTVYAKYVDPNNASNTVALTQFLGQVVAGTVIDGASYSANSITPFPYTGLAGEGNSTGTGPPAYLNYLVFDRNFVLVTGGYVRMSTAGREDGSNVPHEKLYQQLVITQPGYVYTYLSNESTTPMEVYFDDLTITQIKSPIIATNDYYPFGALAQSYSRENSVPNKFLFQEKEWQDDLGLSLYDFDFRQYDPFAPHTTTQDPHAEYYPEMSPYSFLKNNPISNDDPDGMDTRNMNGESEVSNLPPVIASTFVDPNGTIIKHIDDKDDNVYLVTDPSSWDGQSKDGLSVIARESPGEKYTPGKSITDFKTRAPLPENDAIEPDYTLEAFAIPLFSWMKNLKWLNILNKAGGGKIVFGKTANQIYHAFRHIEKAGLSRELVEQAIRKDLEKAASKIVQGTPLNQTIKVGSQEITYTAYKLPTGEINVGRITLPKN